jgi:hypothetical protein
MATVNFLYRSKKENSNLILRLLFRYGNNDYVIGAKTKLFVSRHYWNNLHKKKSNDIEILNKQTELNAEINKLSGHLIKAFNNANTDLVSKSWLLAQLEHYYNPTSSAKPLPVDLIGYLDYFIHKRSGQFKIQTIKNYKVVKEQLLRYQQFLDTPILIKDINEEFRLNFEKFLVNKKYSRNTFAKTLSSVLTLCRDAKYNGLEVSHQLEKLRAKYHPIEKIYLSLEELEEIKGCDLPDYLDNARDWLIISCFTGQRVSDFMRFTHEQIREEKGKYLIEFTQKKTNKIMTIPVHGEVSEVLQKRNGDFPRPISDQKYNDYIKEVCRIANLTKQINGSKLGRVIIDGKSEYRKQEGKYEKWELVSSHIGRRSFATNFYGQIPTTYLIYVTGHSTEKMFLNYIGKSNKDLALELTKYF